MSLNTFLGRQFSHEGRAGRLEFFSYLVVTLLLVAALMAPLVWVGWEFVNDSIEYGPDYALLMTEDEDLSVGTLIFLYVWFYVGWVAMLCVNIATVMTSCRRLTDMGWSKWCVLIWFVPVFNLLFSILPKSREIHTNSFSCL